MEPSNSVSQFVSRRVQPVWLAYGIALIFLSIVFYQFLKMLEKSKATESQSQQRIGELERQMAELRQNRRM